MSDATLEQINDAIDAVFADALILTIKAANLPDYISELKGANPMPAIQFDFPLEAKDAVDLFAKANACSTVPKDDRIILVTTKEKVADRAKKEITTAPLAEGPFPLKTFRLARLDHDGSLSET